MKKLAALSINGQTINTPGGVPQLSSTFTLDNIIGVLITILIVVTVIIALSYLIWGGIDFITSEGKKEKKRSARLKITFSIVGLVIAFLALLFVRLIYGLFGANSL